MQHAQRHPNRQPDRHTETLEAAVLLVSIQAAPTYLPTMWHMCSAKLMPSASKSSTGLQMLAEIMQEEAESETPLPHARPQDMTEVP
jgi:hypothetical protein